MPPCTINIDTDERNQLIDDFLLAANGKEVHSVDIAWFLNLDPLYVNYWLRKHNKGNWCNGKSQSWWKWFPQNESDFPSDDEKRMDAMTRLE